MSGTFTFKKRGRESSSSYQINPMFPFGNIGKRNKRKKEDQNSLFLVSDCLLTNRRTFIQRIIMYPWIMLGTFSFKSRPMVAWSLPRIQGQRNHLTRLPSRNREFTLKCYKILKSWTPCWFATCQTLSKFTGSLDSLLVFNAKRTQAVVSHYKYILKHNQLYILYPLF